MVTCVLCDAPIAEGEGTPYPYSEETLRVMTKLYPDLDQAKLAEVQLCPRCVKLPKAERKRLAREALERECKKVFARFHGDVSGSTHLRRWSAPIRSPEEIQVSPRGAEPRRPPPPITSGRFPDGTSRSEQPHLGVDPTHNRVETPTKRSPSLGTARSSSSGVRSPEKSEETGSVTKS